MFPGNFYLDPSYPVDLALITHSHTDHARPGNNKILATNDTINIMKIRYGKNYCNYSQKIELNESINVNGVNIKFISAGHIIGSSQIYLEYKGEIVIISGDYKEEKILHARPLKLKNVIHLLLKQHLDYQFSLILKINKKQKKLLNLWKIIKNTVT